MGCRAVEFDCYDGDENGPIVKHAYTLVRPCLFQSIIRTIQPNLFKASPYVFLSIILLELLNELFFFFVT